MTRYIDRNWAKWEENLAPILLAAAEEERSKARRTAAKMNADDPDMEERKATEEKLNTEHVPEVDNTHFATVSAFDGGQAQ